MFVWYGCGSREDEHIAALNYAKIIASNAAGIIELSEGQNDNDEMFWMILGEGQYAKADYWKWKREASAADPRIWRVDVKRASNAVKFQYRIGVSFTYRIYRFILLTRFRTICETSLSIL